MTNVTAADRMTDRMTAKYEPVAVCASTAMMLPGAAGAAQRAAEEHVRRDARHATADEREDQDRLHERVREVHLVDAAEELDHRGAGSRGACRADAEEGEREQQADAGAGVGLEEEQDRRPVLGGLLRCRAGSARRG